MDVERKARSGSLRLKEEDWFLAGLVGRMEEGGGLDAWV